MKAFTSLRLSQLSVPFTIIAIALWFYSTAQSKLVIGNLGLVHSFPLSFYLAFAFLQFSSFLLLHSSGGKSTKLLPALQISLFILGFWLTPMLIGGSQPLICHAYELFANIDYIIRNGHLDSTIVFYHLWPGAWILYTFVFQSLGMRECMHDISFVVEMAPIVYQFLFLLPLWVLLRRLPSGNKSATLIGIGAMIFYLGNWVGQSYLSAQSFSYFLFLIILVLLSKSSTRAKDDALLILVFVVITISHIMTALYVLGILMLFCFMKKFRKPNIMRTIVCAAFLAFWMLYSLPSPFTYNVLPILLRNICYPTSIFVRAMGNESHQTVFKIRILTSAILFSLSVTGFILSHKTNGSKNANRTPWGIILGILGVSFMLTLINPHEMLERTFFFLLPVMAYFVTKLLNRRTTSYVLLMVMVLLVPLSLVSLYGNQVVDHQTAGDLASVKFLYEHTFSGYVYIGLYPDRPGGSGPAPFGYMLYPERYHLTRELDIRDGPIYMPFGRPEEAYYDFVLDDLQTFTKIRSSLIDDKNFNLAYSSGDRSIYVIER